MCVCETRVTEVVWRLPNVYFAPRRPNGETMVDKSRYKDPPRWPPQRTAKQRAVGLLMRGILMAVPYVLLTIGICGVVYAYHRIGSHPVTYQRWH